MSLYYVFDGELFTKHYTPGPFIVFLDNEAHYKENLHQLGYVSRRGTQ